MARTYLFADEAGDFTFNKNFNVSKYFILCTVYLESCEVGDKLLSLRRDLEWRNFELGEYFHATTDKQAVRDEVFALLQNETFKIDATLMEKSKAQPQVRATKYSFYKYGWYFHFKNIAPTTFKPENELLVAAASLGNRKERSGFTEGVHDVIQQTLRRDQWETMFAPARTDPCFQVADYCAWAIQRKWESNHVDIRSYRLIKDKIDREYDLWSRGTKHYY